MATDEPVEEAQRCRTCGHGESSHVENEDEWGHCNDCGPEFAGVHEFDAEAEGARPLDELWNAYNDLVVGALQFGIVTTDAELDAARESIEAAIRKEATTAFQAKLDDVTGRLNRVRTLCDQRGNRLADVEIEAVEWRTRAEVAEKLRPALQALVDKILGPDEGATAWDELLDLADAAAHALTAESVTPTGEAEA